MKIETIKQNISSCRSELMGFAIILILIEHFQFFGLFDYGDLSFFASLGSIGVDIFLFLSGFGLWNGYSEKIRVGTFYKRRFLRIIPSYLCLMILFDIILLHPEYILSPNEWMGHLNNNWFIPFILLMYLIFPLASKIQRKWLYVPLCIACMLSISLTIVLIHYNRDNIHMVPMLMAQRIPIFFIGMLFADKRFILRDIRKRYIVSCLILSLFALYCFYWIYNIQWTKYILYIPFSLSVIVLLSEYFVCVGSGLLKCIGQYTLEMYLISLFLMQQVASRNDGAYVKIKAVGIIMLTFFGAILVRKMMERLTKCIRK